MAAYDKGILMTNGFAIAAKKPADLKSIAETIEERNSYVTKNIAYEGMIVFVNEDKKTYQLIDNNWAEFGTSSGGSSNTQIYDGLDSTSNTLALSAKQGNVLNTNINSHINDTSKHITALERSMWNNKAEKSLASQTESGLMSSADKFKLDSIATSANKYEHPDTHPASIIVEDSTHNFVSQQQLDKINAIPEDYNYLDTGYTHPDTHPATMIVEDSTHRFVTDDEKGIWNAKASTTVATETNNGLMSTSMVIKLNSISSGANYYVHPTTHPASIIVQDANNRFVTDAQIATWNTGASITKATQTTDGLMAKEDKIKLDSINTSNILSDEDISKLNNIEAGANKYMHPETHPSTMIVEDSTHRFVTDDEKLRWDNKAPNVIASIIENGLMTKEDKIKLDGIEEGANKYMHPSNHPASIITQDTNNRFVTDTQIEYWNSKATTSLSSQTESGLMSSSDKIKLDSIASGANNYVHPDTHPATMIVEDVAHRFVTDAEKATWNSKLDSIESATVTDDGLMSSEMVIKLNSIQEGANNYTHPATHEASIITQTSEYRFVTDKEKAEWTAKAPTTIATSDFNGLMSKEDKTKLDGIAYNANNYTHPTTHPASIIIEDSTHRFVTQTQISNWDSKPTSKEDLGLGNVTNDAQVKRSEMGIAGGVATLDENGVVPDYQLPSYVSDIIEVNSYSKLPTKGETNKIYVTTDTNLTYRWSGSQYVEIASGLALGETSSTAYAGDKGKANAQSIASILNGTVVVPKAVDAATVSGFTVGISVPSNAKFTDTIYTHPTTHPASIIVQDSSNRFVTDAQIAAWNAKAATSIATSSADGLLSKGDKAKLDGIEYAANNYTHPTTHPASIIVQDANNRFVTDVEKAAWNAKAPTTVATTVANGLMAKEDKVELASLRAKVTELETLYNQMLAKLKTAVFYE